MSWRYLGEQLERYAQGAARRALDWGRSAADSAWTAAAEFGSATQHAASQAAQGAAKLGKEWVAEGAATVAERGAQWATADAQRFDKLRGKLDKRDRFTAPSTQVCQACDKGQTAYVHPSEQDGQFMGSDCPKTHATQPREGTKPKGCACGRNGKPFPKVVFTNGINNTPEQVCATMHALAESRCVEVIAVYNATYADPNLKAPERRLSDYDQAAMDGAQGARKGARIGAATGQPYGAAMGAAAGAVVGAAPEVALQEAGRLGAVGDVLDCADTIAGTGDQAASKRLAAMIVDAMNRTPAEMTIYAHSQGGLNAADAIARAKRKLLQHELTSWPTPGLPTRERLALAHQAVDRKLANLSVFSFGTLERGWPDGPQYNRFTNELDPIPRVIRAAQSGLAPDQQARDPAYAAPVERFRAAPSWSPIAAHGMAEAYIPHLNHQHPSGPCC
jgi:hypothetical protein